MNGILLNQGGAGAVSSVNGKTGEINLSIEDIDNNKIIKTDNENFTASGSMFTFKVTPGGLDYSASLNTCCSFDISQNGLEVTGDPSFLDEDIILNQVAWKDENQQEVIITTHKLSEKADEEALERLQYYGDANIIPTDESYFNITEDGAISLKEEIKSKATTTDEYIAELTNIIIPYKIGNQIVTSIGDDAFDKCSGLTNIIIPNSITHIGMGAFGKCSGLTNIKIPDSVISIWNYAFSHCLNLERIIIPNSVTELGDEEVFYDCQKLTNITIPDKITTIKDSLFRNCTGLTNIIIPDSVVHIHPWAFHGCSSDLTIICSQGSVADTYAKENGIKVRYNNIDISSILRFDEDGYLVVTIDGVEKRFSPETT